MPPRKTPAKTTTKKKRTKEEQVQEEDESRGDAISTGTAWVHFTAWPEDTVKKKPQRKATKVVVDPTPTIPPSTEKTLFFLPDGDYVKQVVTQREFTIFLSEHGGVYCIGKNSFGMLGLGDYKSRDEITKNSLIEKEMRNNKDKCVKVACGEYYTFFISEKGMVYGCGYGDNSLLALPKKKPKTSTPKRLTCFDLLPQGENCISDILCNQEFTIFITKNKQVYLVGHNEHGILEQECKLLVT